MKATNRLLVAALEALSIVVVCLALAAGGCGSSGGRKAPTPPNAVLVVEQNPVDVGQQVVMNGSLSTDPEGSDDDLLYLWTLVSPLDSDAEFESHCSGDTVADGAEDVCTTDEGVCSDDMNETCTTDSDCGDMGETCIGECPEDETCLVDSSRTMDYATFTPDVGGSYEVRMLIDGAEASDIALARILTNPTLYVVGSLLSFGGTLGGFIGASADAEEFAASATTGVASPVDGNVMLAVPDPPRIREFSGSDATIIGTFGETGDFSEIPAALAYDPSDNLNVAYEDGLVRVFDGDQGLFIRVFGDVTAAGEDVVSMKFSSDSGELYVVDGRAGQPLRVYSSDGTFLRSADTGAARATDLVFDGDPATRLLVSDYAGQVVSCTTDASVCDVLGSTDTLLAGSILLAIDVNPANTVPEEAAILVADFSGSQVIGCNDEGTACSPFGETTGQDSGYLDLLFAPPVPETTTTTTLEGATTTTTSVTTTSVTTTTSSTTTTLTTTTSCTCTPPESTTTTTTTVP